MGSKPEDMRGDDIDDANQEPVKESLQNHVSIIYVSNVESSCAAPSEQAREPSDNLSNINDSVASGTSNLSNIKTQNADIAKECDLLSQRSSSRQSGVSLQH